MMENHKKNIDDLFKERLGNYTETPPPQVWEALGKRLDGNKKTRRFFPWYWPLLTISFIVLLGGVVWKISDKPGTINGKTILARNEPVTTMGTNTPATDPAQTNVNIIEPSINNNLNKKITHPQTQNNIAKATNSNTNQNNNEVKNSLADTDNKQINSETIVPKGNSNEVNSKGPKADNEATNNNVVNGENAKTEIEQVAINKIEPKQTAINNNYSSAPKYTAKEAVHESKPVPAETEIDQVELSKIEPKETTVKNINNSTPKYAAKVAVFESKPMPIETGMEHEALSKIEPKESSIKNTYNSSPKYAAKEAVYESKQTPAEKVVEQPIAAPFIEDKSLALKTAASSTVDDKGNNNGTRPDAATLAKFNKFEEGIKAGYEAGFNNSTARKFVVVPYLQYNLNRKFALLFQPSVNVSTVNYINLNGTLPFYKRNESTNTSTLNSTPVINAFDPHDTLGYMTHYNYTQSHNSIIKSYASGGTYLEFELPILMKYQINPKLSAYGGLTITLGKYVPTKENTFNSASILVSGASKDTFIAKGQPLPAAPPIDSVITYSGNPISQYSGPLYSSQGYLLRFGYMLGFSYEFRKKWLFDVLIQQSVAKSYVQGGYDINNPLTLPYCRIMLGYKLGNIPIHLFK